MVIIAGRGSKRLASMLLVLMLSGCGLAQSMSDGTVAVTKSIFYREVKTLHFDIRAREELNSNDAGIPLPTVVRIYQLKDRLAFDSTDYPSLFARDSQAAKADIVTQKDVRLLPGSAIMIDEPLDVSARYVAVVAMFMSPDLGRNDWRIVLERDQLDPDEPRVIVAERHRLAIRAPEDQ